MSHDALIDALSGYVTTDANGTVVYCNSKGEPHRLDGPAVIYASHDTCKWYRNGKLHREDGPAITFASGVCFWYLDGIHYTKTGHRRKLQGTL